MFKKTMFVLIIIALVVGSWLLLVDSKVKIATDNKSPESPAPSSPAAVPPEQESTPTTTINLSHNLTKSFEPDSFRLVLGVETENASVETALSENNEKMKRVMSALQNINNIEISTSDFQIAPVTERDPKTDRKNTVAYKVVNKIEVVTSKLEASGKIIQTAAEAGANRVQSISFLLKDSQQARDQVLNEAIRGLEEKAELIAGSLDVDDYRLKELSVNDSFRRPLQAENYRLSTAQAPPISTEDIKISTNLQAEYIFNK